MNALISLRPTTRNAVVGLLPQPPLDRERAIFVPICTAVVMSFSIVAILACLRCVHLCNQSLYLRIIIVEYLADRGPAVTPCCSTSNPYRSLWVGHSE
jgi:uncharacterized membrane protein YozB (DUF420 family)